MPCVNRNRHAFSPMTFNTEGLPRTPCSKGFGSTKAVQKFWILRKRLETQGQEMAPQVGLEPTTLRLTAGCSAIELLRSDVVQVYHSLRFTPPAATEAAHFFLAPYSPTEKPSPAGSHHSCRDVRPFLEPSA